MMIVTKKTFSSVRYLFVGFVGALTLYAGAEALVASDRGTIGLSDCGDAATPCRLETLHVTATRVAGQTPQPVDARAVGTVSAAPVAKPATLAES
jgi:hypothetical protein